MIEKFEIHTDVLVLGRESDNKMQPATLMFKVSGVDYDRAVFLGSFESTYETPQGELQSLAKKHIPYPAGHIHFDYECSLPNGAMQFVTNCGDRGNAREITII